MTRAANKRTKFRGRRESGTFLLIPHAVADCPRYLALSGSAVKLLLDFARQFNGRNNGNMAAPWSRMQKRGWRSQGTLWRALGELLELRLIVETRQGGLHACSLFALTWLPIDDNLAHDVKGTAKAPGGWQDPILASQRKRPRTQWANPKRPMMLGAIASAETELSRYQNSTSRSRNSAK